MSRVHAEGSAELDARDVMGSGAHDQSLDRDTNLFVDILNNTGDVTTGAEKICWTGSGTLSVYAVGTNPWTGSPTALHTLASGACTTALATVGEYPVRPSVDDQTVGTRWDIRVCDFDDVCAIDSVSERTGRAWSRQWTFELGAAVYTQARANNGSVYAIVPGGDVGLDAVIEMTLDGVSGADYKLYANSIGPQVAADDSRVGRSVPRNATYEVIPEFKLYLNPPEIAQYNWREPETTSVELAPSCGTGVVLDTAPGTISFDSNVTGQYVVVCDVDNDDVFDFASNTDFSSFGAAAIGTNVVAWNGRDNNNVNAAAGTYDCIIRLNVGEFHYVGEDIETAFNGIRLFRVESNKLTRTPINMFWDDGLILPADAENMPAPVSRPAASEPEPDGLDPVSYTTAAAAFRRSGGGTPSGNARAWGNFDADGKGNNTFLDTFSAADTAQSPIFQITIITAAGDADADALSNQRECAIGADPQDDDSDDDGVNDGFEATNSTLPNTDSGVDAIPDVLDPDDDGDGIPTLTELGGENGDGNPSDAANSDSAADGADYLDIDSDDDGVDDADDVAPTNPLICRDTDGDSCDDCALTGDDGSGGDPADDGADTDGDGDCNDGSTGDDDDDNDGVLDGPDSADLIATQCRDQDDDGCDDCSITGANSSGGAVMNDGPDFDMDGACNDGAPGNPNDGDPDDDNDGVADADDSAPLDDNVCLDADGDSCDDCTNTGGDESGGDPDDDGTDTDGDGICDLDEADSDGDGVPDPIDLDADNDGIPNADERDEDTDEDGLNNAIDLDADGDGLTDILEGGGGSFDADADGVIDELVDANSDGLHDPLQVSGDELPLPNSDSDDDPHFLDLDSDADGLLDIVEAGAIDLDDNGNGRVDDDADDNGNGLADEVDPDSGLASPGTPLAPPDSDNDGDDDFRDPDDDNDGISTLTELDDADEYGDDIDEDDAPNYLDTDTDGDGRLDSAESAGDGDANDNGTPDYIEPFMQVEPPVVDDDADDDGLTDEEERDDGEDRDTDEDGISDFEDPDDDGDGILTRDELPLGDTDGNGNPNYRDADDDGDGVLTRDERTQVREDIDTDDDGTPNHLDADDDDDGIPTHEERAPASTDIDTDDDGDPNYLDPDDDNDGIPTRDERTEDGEDIDTDADAIPNHLDPDDDGDGIATEEERTDAGEDIDTDDDGTPNYLDTDDDGDGIETDVEFSDGDEFGNDVDQDGTPNHLDTDSDGDGILDEVEAEQDDDGNNVPDYLEETAGGGTFAGGALCSISSAPPSGQGSWLSLGLLVLALSTLMLRSRNHPSRSPRNPRTR